MSKIKNKQRILSTLNKTVALTAERIANDASMLVDKSKSEISIGQYKIVKVDELYRVKHKKKTLYTDITLIETAVALILNLSTNQVCDNKELLQLDNSYNKYITDIMFYTHSYRNSPKETAGFYVDRILVSKDRASMIKDKIRYYSLYP